MKTIKLAQLMIEQVQVEYNPNPLRWTTIYASAAVSIFVVIASIYGNRIAPVAGIMSVIISFATVIGSVIIGAIASLSRNSDEVTASLQLVAVWVNAVEAYFSCKHRFFCNYWKIEQSRSNDFDLNRQFWHLLLY